MYTISEGRTNCTLCREMMCVQLYQLLSHELQASYV